MQSSVGNTNRHILLTGPPGVGKTTLVQKVCNMLQEAGIPTKGFFTEEVRDGGKRIGFDVVTLDRKRGTLARLSQGCIGAVSSYTVGPYAVTLKSFETFALPMFTAQSNAGGGVLVLDEIGRMELLSYQFKQEVKRVFSNPSITILATIPVKPLPFIETLRQSSNTSVIMVDRSNRDDLVDQVFDMFTKT